MGLLDDFSTLSDSAKQYALNALARFGNGVGNTVNAIPGNAQRLAQGLLTLPQTVHNDMAGLLSPQVNQRVQQTYQPTVSSLITNPPQQANPQQWMNQGMALAGMAPVTAPIGMFIGQGAKTWDAIAAQKANEMLQAGHDPRQVWQQTGTMRGVDGALRQEIPDNAAQFKPNQLFLNHPEGSRQGNVLNHPNLYANYPDLQNIDVSRSGVGGSYSNTTMNGDSIGENITIGSRAVRKLPEGFSVSPTEAKSINLHELQHAIQQREGWSNGGSPDDIASQMGGELADFYSPQEKYNLYRNLAGEAEARMTQARMNLDAAQRLQHYPYDPGPYGLDVPQNQLIVRGLLGN